ncbi:MAG: M67 family metallopeptidase [Lachnospiraceae bacterium]|nr:M67 family metallopeptidase [Lachnospiraceae bacterium]
MIIFEKRFIEQLYREAQEQYPNECCGILLGLAAADGERIVLQVRPAANMSPEGEKQKHFRIPSEMILEAERSAALNGYEIIGFYHSHPDCEAVPSELDADYAIEGLSYPIISVRKGKVKEVHSWEMTSKEDDRYFRKECIEIRDRK